MKTTEQITRDEALQYFVKEQCKRRMKELLEAGTVFLVWKGLNENFKEFSEGINHKFPAVIHYVHNNFFLKSL